LREAPAAVHAGLRRIAEVTRAFALASLAAGADGFFFATQLADRNKLDEAAYREFGIPYDLQILAELPAESPLLLHFHGHTPMLELVDRYPAGALSWHDRRFGPSLANVRQGQTRPVAGGIDEEAIVAATPRDVASQVADTLRANDHRGLIVAPGCVIPVAAPPENIRAALEAARVGDAA
jgi:uroporphyrinogen decarboxylase